MFNCLHITDAEFFPYFPYRNQFLGAIGHENMEHWPWHKVIHATSTVTLEVELEPAPIAPIRIPNTLLSVKKAL
jgi:hypothetical protein